MSTSVTLPIGGQPQNLWPGIKEFAARGGFYNGLQPAVVGKVWYCNGNEEPASDRQGPVGADGNSGLSPLSPFATIERAFDFISSGDVIVLTGVFREQLVAPLNVYDITIIGGANRPRQATSGGVATGGGATWMPPTSPVATTPLLEIRAAGWSIFNIEMTPVNASAAVRLTRSASVDTTDASHFTMANCLIGANGGTTSIGVEDNGGCSRVLLDNNRFEGLAGTAILSLNTAAAVPLGWVVSNNLFLRNTNAIAMSSTQGLFWNNVFNQAANDANNKVNLVSVAGQGSLNMVLNNYFSDVAANITIAKGYKPGTTDIWRNWGTGAADAIVAVPV